MNRVLGILILMAIVGVEVVTFFDLAPQGGREDAEISAPRSSASDRT